MLETVITESRKLPARLWKQVLGELIDSGPVLKSQSNSVPALVIGGARDEVFGADEQASRAAMLPDSALHLEETAGHPLQWELPDVFVQAFRPRVAGWDPLAAGMRRRSGIRQIRRFFRDPSNVERLTRRHWTAARPGFAPLAKKWLGLLDFCCKLLIPCQPNPSSWRACAGEFDVFDVLSQVLSDVEREGAAWLAAGRCVRYALSAP